MLKKIRLVIAEDQEILRKSLVLLLSKVEGLSVIGEVAHGKELLRFLKTTKADIVLMDIDMPVMNGHETINELNAQFPEVKTIMLSMYAADKVIAGFMKSGARAYLPKNSGVDVLVNTIQLVHKNGFYFSDEVSQAMVNAAIKEKEEQEIERAINFTGRELEIIRYLCEGKTSKEIANVLNVTIRTIDFHRTNVYAKTKSRNVADLGKYAIQNGVVKI